MSNTKETKKQISTLINNLLNNMENKEALDNLLTNIKGIYKTNHLDNILDSQNISDLYENTIIPEFALLTQNGIINCKDVSLKSYDKTCDKYLLSNKDTTVSVSGKTFLELTSKEKPTHSFSPEDPNYKKLLLSQYEDFFSPRDNCASYFTHNFSVYCRKEANSPLDAINISSEIYNRMSKSEQKKTLLLLKQIRKEDETINQCIIRLYHEAIKEVPLNENYVKTKLPNKTIAHPFYDTISTKGELVDKNLSLKIGDVIDNLSFKISSPFSNSKETLREKVSVISSSEEGNVILLMDGNKSFYEIPRDTFLEKYRENQVTKKRMERKNTKSNTIEIER